LKELSSGSRSNLRLFFSLFITSRTITHHKLFGTQTFFELIISHSRIQSAFATQPTRQKTTSNMHFSKMIIAAIGTTALTIQPAASAP